MKRAKLLGRMACRRKRGGNVALTINVLNIDQVLARFRGAQRVIEEEAEDAVDSILAFGIQRLSAYPPERSGQTYQRTGALGRGWQQPDRTFRLGGGGLSAALTNSVPYAPLVQGERQAWMHKGRWPTITNVQAEMDGYAGGIWNDTGDRIAKRLES